MIPDTGYDWEVRRQRMEIRIEHVTKTIKKTTVLEDIVLTLKSGVIYGLKGENGSGKTMLMRVISGLIMPTKGKVFIDEKELHKDIDFPESIGMLLENPSFLKEYTGMKNLKMLADLQNTISDEDIEEALERVGLEPHDSRKYKKYSLGMKQRLGIAAAIMGNPELIILDEPFNAIDEAGVAKIKREIIREKEMGKLIIIACHDTSSFEELADEVYALSNGKLKN